MEALKVVYTGKNVEIKKIINGLVNDIGGLEFVSFETWAALSNALKTIQPTLFLVDHFIPVLSGVEIIKKIRQSSSAPVLFFTRIHSKTTIEKVFRFGATDHIFFPCDQAMLKELMIKRILWSMEKQAQSETDSAEKKA